MNLGQFDALNIPDFSEILEYHIAEGRWLADDLYDGLQLPTAQGQSLNISQNEHQKVCDFLKENNINAITVGEEFNKAKHLYKKFK